MLYNKKTINDIDVNGKVVLIRVDFNVPIQNGTISNDKRMVAALPTIKKLLESDTKLVLLSHLGKVKTLDDLKKKSLKPVYEHLKTLLPDVHIEFEENNTNKNLKDKIKSLPSKSIIVLENTRFNDIDEKGIITKKESSNDSALAKFWASLGDVYVNDAFGTSHRKHASNVGIASNVKESCIGLLIEKEISMLSKPLTNPEKPFVAIFGGAKVTDKIKSIENIAKFADHILIGGGMAFTFLKVQGNEIGKSLYEEETFEIAKNLLDKYKDKIVLPIDSLAATEFADVKAKKFTNDKFNKDYMGLDIGPKTVKLFNQYLKTAKTIVWNGPLGVSEFENFSKGNLKICKAIAKTVIKNSTFALIGGGDSAAAAIKLGFEDRFSHISTGGGASIQFLEGNDLPGISSIKDKNSSEHDVKDTTKQSTLKNTTKKEQNKKVTKKNVNLSKDKKTSSISKKVASKQPTKKTTTSAKSKAKK